MARILLTGAAGFVGRKLLSLPEASPHAWTALDLGFAPGWAPGTHVTESVVDDLSDVASLREVVRRTRPEVVVHLAGWTGKGGDAGNRAALLKANLASTWNLLDALALEGGAPAQFVLASSALVYGGRPGPFREDMETAPPDEYATTKWLAEEAVRAFARRGAVVPTVVRPAVLYGPGQKGPMFVPSLVRAIAAGERFPMTGGAQMRDLVHVADAAAAVLSLVGRRLPGIFNIGTGTGTPMIDVARKVAGMAGRTDLLGVGDLEYRPNEVWNYAVDVSALRAATGWVPRIGLDEGLRETLDKEMEA